MSTSAQYRALREIFDTKDEETQAALRRRVVEVADLVLYQHSKGKLTCGCPAPNGELAMNDELWDIFMDEEFANYYSELLCREGNAEDECQLLANYWIMALASTNQTQYMPIIKHLAEVNIYGL